MKKLSLFAVWIAAALATASQAPAATPAPRIPNFLDLPPVQTLSGAYLAAKSAQLDGNHEQAAAFFDRALALSPDSRTLQSEALIAYVAVGRLQDATALARLLKGDEVSDKLARMVLGTDAIARGGYDAATEALELSDPSDFDRLIVAELKAWADAGAGRVDEALSDLDRMEGAPWFEVYNTYQKGLIALVAERPAVARRELRSIIEDQASARTSFDVFVGAVDALARLEAREGNRERALEVIDLGLELLVDFDPLRSLRERIERGETIAPAVSSVREGAAQAFYVLAQAINQGEGQQIALLYHQLARALAPGDASILVALASIAEGSEQYEHAIELYEQVPSDSGYAQYADIQIGINLWQIDRKDDAEERLKRAIENDPSDIRAVRALASLYGQDKRWELTTDLWDRALELAEEQNAVNWDLLFRRGISYERTNQWERAEEDFKAALEMSPNQPEVLNYLAYTWIDQNENLDESLEMIREAVEMRPNDGHIIDSLGWAHYRLGNYAEAVEELERAILLMPTDPTVNDHLGDAYWQVGREREARYQWQRALIGEPEPEPEVEAEIRRKLRDGLEPRAPRAAQADAPEGKTRAGPSPSQKPADKGAAGAAPSSGRD